MERAWGTRCKEKEKKQKPKNLRKGTQDKKEGKRGGGSRRKTGCGQESREGEDACRQRTPPKERLGEGGKGRRHPPRVKEGDPKCHRALRE